MKQFKPGFTTIVFVILLAGTVLLAQEEDASKKTYRLVSSRQSGSVDLVEKSFDAAGTLQLELDPDSLVSKSSPGNEEKKNAKDSSKEAESAKEPVIQSIPMKVTSRQSYEEMLIQAGNLLQGENAKSTLGAWYFLENETGIKIGESEAKPELNLNQPLIGVDIKGAQVNFFRQDGFLTRDELDLVNVQGNTLLLDHILPNKSVKVGDSWKQSPDTMALLLQLDLVFNLDIQTTLSEVKKNVAILETKGWIEGSCEGSTSKINVTGKAFFDVTRGRILWFGMVIEEKRTAGYVTPGMDVTAKVQYKIKPLDESKNLTSDATSKLTFDEAQYGLILFEDPGDAWKFVLTPDWEPMNQNKYQSNFRLLREGELVAQCTVAKVQTPKISQNMKPDEFANEVKEMLKDNFQSILDVKTLKSADGSDVYRVDVAAKYEGLDLRYICYLITQKDAKEPKQYTMIFTLEDELLEKFSDANEQMIQSFSWK
ncbi:MAG: hypothetical protein IJU53_03830 [Thermoguttaceae bacterium]|nr:hypothetical protein [Thermoguttaceae bacterium]